MAHTIERPATLTISKPASAEVDAIGFDLDGTLINSFPLQRRALVTLLRMVGKPVDDALIDKALHLGYPRHLEQLRIGYLSKEYWKALSETYGKAEAFGFAAGATARLAKMGVKLFVVTDLPRGPAEHLLNACGLLDRFSPIITAQDVHGPKPNPEGLGKAVEQLGIAPWRAVYVGDSPKDIAAARAAGMISVGVGWGSGAFAQLANEGADAVFMNPGDLYFWLLGHGVFGPAKCVDCPRIVDPRRKERDWIPCNTQCPSRNRAWLMTGSGAVASCRTCGSRDGLVGTTGLCPSCNTRQHHGTLFVDAAYVATAYDTSTGAASRSPITRAVQRFKGRDGSPADRRYALGLSTLFLSSSILSLQRELEINDDRSRVAFHPLPGIVVPAPSSKGSFEERGFNPVEELLAALLLPVLVAHLEAGIETIGADKLITRPWKEISLELNTLPVNQANGDKWRIANALQNNGLSVHAGGGAAATDVEHAISLVPGMEDVVRGQTIFLVDDVITSGGTINRCARVLKEAGAARVMAIALGRSTQIPTPPPVYAGSCPVCGKLLLLKHRSSDGKPFHGCSGWRKDGSGCSFTRDVPLTPAASPINTYDPDHFDDIAF